MADARRIARRKRYVIASLRQPKVAVMLMLGFSSGLPFLLTGNTLGYWLRDEGTTLGAIGFMSWVGLAYSLKFLWAPGGSRGPMTPMSSDYSPPRISLATGSRC